MSHLYVNVRRVWGKCLRPPTLLFDPLIALLWSWEGSYILRRIDSYCHSSTRYLKYVIPTVCLFRYPRESSTWLRSYCCIYRTDPYSDMCFEMTRVISCSFIKTWEQYKIFSNFTKNKTLSQPVKTPASEVVGWAPIQGSHQPPCSDPVFPMVQLSCVIWQEIAPYRWVYLYLNLRLTGAFLNVYWIECFKTNFVHSLGRTILDFMWLKVFELSDHPILLLTPFDPHLCIIDMIGLLQNWFPFDFEERSGV